MSRTRVTVCAVPGCYELTPCIQHSRPKNASWSPQRDRKAHHKLRAVVVKARGPRCERCGWEALDSRGRGLQMHHHGPKDLPEHVTLLCRKCHRDVDRSAR